jgi:hypothetical protein
MSSKKRPRGRPTGIKPSDEDWKIVREIETEASKLGCSFDDALAKAIPRLKRMGLLSKAAAHNTHAQRIRRIERALDNRHPLRGGASLKNLVRIWELRHKK